MEGQTDAAEVQAEKLGLTGSARLDGVNKDGALLHSSVHSG